MYITKVSPGSAFDRYQRVFSSEMLYNPRTRRVKRRHTRVYFNLNITYTSTVTRLQIASDCNPSSTNRMVSCYSLSSQAEAARCHSHLLVFMCLKCEGKVEEREDQFIVVADPSQACQLSFNRQHYRCLSVCWEISFY